MTQEGGHEGQTPGWAPPSGPPVAGGAANPPGPAGAPPPPPPPPPGYAGATAPPPPAQPAGYGVAAAPPGYVVPGQPGVVMQQTKTNGMAIASLVLGIIWLGGLGSLLALIFGMMGKNQIDSSAGGQTGRGMAIAGIVLGIVGLVGAILYWVLIVIVAVNSPGDSSNARIY